MIIDNNRKMDFSKSRADIEFSKLMTSLSFLISNESVRNNGDLEIFRNIRSLLETTNLINHWKP